METQHHVIGQKTGQSVITNPAMIIIALAVFFVILILLFEIFYRVKIGRAICNFTGGILVQITGYVGILSGPLKTGVEAGCQLLNF